MILKKSEWPKKLNDMTHDELSLLDSAAAASPDWRKSPMDALVDLPYLIERQMSSSGSEFVWFSEPVKIVDDLAPTPPSVPTTPEPPPKPSTDVPVWDLVIADMRTRDENGARKYGVRLTAGDGRKSLIDAYQEALDLAVYLRKEIRERYGI